ncbi:7298_t:CDS:2 [Ambispora gerdemannii]|uniref:7298_t:CDS:1 n=1 Tax=Ambispora gerdemannii TaxID=144530 RepID=A0A9N9BFW7_9GLOM|nr:7298_t:CDS:2 [Ambispora gerdemannii]
MEQKGQIIKSTILPSPSQVVPSQLSSRIKPRILIVGIVQWARQEVYLMSAKYEFEMCTAENREQFIEFCRERYQGVVAIYRNNVTSDVSQRIGKFDKILISNLPDSVKFICCYGVNYDTIDINACSNKKIMVSNTPDPVYNATADTVMFLILSTCRNAFAAQNNLRNGNWKFGLQRGTNLAGKTLGMYGMGGVGRVVAKRAYAFRMKIQYYSRSRLDIGTEAQLHAEYVTLNQLFQTSDIISLNLPLRPDTTHIIGQREFSQMKRGVIIINTSAGGLIDEQALVNALESGQVASAGLDVFENEPSIQSGLLTRDNVTLLPHISTFTSDTEYEMELLVLRNLQTALNTDKLVNLVKEQNVESLSDLFSLAFGGF